MVSLRKIYAASFVDNDRFSIAKDPFPQRLKLALKVSH
jgi:hypothetical protein